MQKFHAHHKTRILLAVNHAAISSNMTSMFHAHPENGKVHSHAFTQYYSCIIVTLMAYSQLR